MLQVEDGGSCRGIWIARMNVNSSRIIRISKNVSIIWFFFENETFGWKTKQFFVDFCRYVEIKSYFCSA